ncbi:MAG TPA: hypothetical protein VGE10_02715 [Zeimonas sp.]
MSERLGADEAAALLREIVDGRRTLRLRDARRPWVQIAVGECVVEAGGAELVFFADSATLDHLVSARLADGRRGRFDDWLMTDGANPLDLLDDGERHEIEQQLHEAR